MQNDSGKPSAVSLGWGGEFVPTLRDGAGGRGMLTQGFTLGYFRVLPYGRRERPSGRGGVRGLPPLPPEIRRKDGAPGTRLLTKRNRMIALFTWKQ